MSTQKTSSFSISSFCLVALLLLYTVQYVRPQDLFLRSPLPLFSLVNIALVALLIVNGELSNIFRYTQIKWIMLLLLWLFVLPLMTDNYLGPIHRTWQFVQFFTFVFGVAILIDNFKKLKTLVHFISICSLFISIYILIEQDSFGRYKLLELANFMVDPNDFSLYINMMIPFIILSYKFSLSPFGKLFYGSGVILLIIVSMLTYSRGGFLGLLAMFFILIVFHPKKVKVVLLLGFSILVALPLIDASWISLMATSTDAESPTAVTRITMWNACWELFKDNPLGVGNGNINLLAYQYITDGILGKKSYNWSDQVAHSFWLTALAEWGIIGFLLLLKIIWINTRDCINLISIQGDSYQALYLKSFGVACLASMVSFLISGSFLTVNYYPHFWYLTSFICAGTGVYYLETSKIKSEEVTS